MLLKSKYYSSAKDISLKMQNTPKDQKKKMAEQLSRIFDFERRFSNKNLLETTKFRRFSTKVNNS